MQELGLKNHVIFFPEFLDENEIFNLLRKSDVILMPYTKTQESSSAAVKFAFAAHKPILVTDLPIFSEYHDEVFKISKCTPADIYEGIEMILEHDELKQKLVNRITEKIMQENWDAVAQTYKELIVELTRRAN